MSTIRTPTPTAGPSSPFVISPNLPPLPQVLGTDPERCVLDAFRTAIAKRVADALPPLTVEQAYTGVDYGKKGVDFTVALPRFRLPGKVDELAKKVLIQVGLTCFLGFVIERVGEDYLSGQCISSSRSSIPRPTLIFSLGD